MTFGFADLGGDIQERMLRYVEKSSRTAMRNVWLKQKVQIVVVDVCLLSDLAASILIRKSGSSGSHRCVPKPCGEMGANSPKARSVPGLSQFGGKLVY
jgi:hypothetical protein